MKYYAKLNSENICNGISQLNDEVIEDNMIELASYDTSVLGKMWTGSVWVDNPNPPEPEQQEPPVTNKDLDTKMDSLEQQLTAVMLGMVDMYSAITENK